MKNIYLSNLSDETTNSLWTNSIELEEYAWLRCAVTVSVWCRAISQWIQIDATNGIRVGSGRLIKTTFHRIVSGFLHCFRISCKEVTVILHWIEYHRDMWRLLTLQKFVDQIDILLHFRLILLIEPNQRSSCEIPRHWPIAKARTIADSWFAQFPFGRFLIDGPQQSLHANGKKYGQHNVEYWIKYE